MKESQVRHNCTIATHTIPLHSRLLHTQLPIGRSGWGIAWYLNSTLIPVISVTRGNTYTFLIYGGSNPSNPGKYHPFYISDSIAGGRLANSPEEVGSLYCTLYCTTEGRHSPHTCSNHWYHLGHYERPQLKYIYKCIHSVHTYGLVSAWSCI